MCNPVLANMFCSFGEDFPAPVWKREAQAVGLGYLTLFQMPFVSFCMQLLQIPLNFSTAIDWDGPRLEQHSAIEKLQTNTKFFWKKKYILGQPVGFCCTHWDHFIWPEVQYELKTKLLSFWLTAVQTLSFWNQTAAEMSPQTNVDPLRGCLTPSPKFTAYS